jgi:hypothetical protein
MLGINFPWVHCGHDFGPSPPAWGGAGVRRDFGEVERELAALRALGAEVTRFWILGGGVNYPVGEDPATVADLVDLPTGPTAAVVHAVGLDALARRIPAARPYRALRLRSDCPLPTLPDAFLRDFEALLGACARAGVRIIPSLTSFELFQPALDAGRGIVKRGRGAFVFGNDAHGPAVREHVSAFLDATLAPLLEASRAHADAIYAWEVVNEPEWAVENGPLQLDPPAYGLAPSLHLVPRAAMSELVRAGVERIAAVGFVATVGFGDPSVPWLEPNVLTRLRALANEGRYVHQRHHYPTLWSSRALPHHDASPITPCMLGELPTAPGSGPTNMRFADEEVRGTERDPDRYLEGRLRLVHEHRGYPVSLLWSARSTDNRKRWEASQREQLRRYAHDAMQHPPGVRR